MAVMHAILAVVMLPVSSQSHPALSCQDRLNSWCNIAANCPIHDRCKDSVFYAANSTSAGNNVPGYRCYASSDLDSDTHTKYIGGTCYCSRSELAVMLCECNHPTNKSSCAPPTPPPTPPPPAPSPGVNILATVFKPGDGGLACFRIPSVVMTSNGTLVAFAEARHGSCSDGAVHEIATSRSVDGGRTWSAIGFAVGGETYYTGNPTAVVSHDGTTEKIVLVYVKHSPKCNGGCGIGNGQVVSTDGGLTWSQPQDLSKDFGIASGALPGPGIGLETNTGRLLVVSHHGAYVDDYVTMSDDHGQTWKTVNHSFPKMDEAQMTQLPNGLIMLNMRHTSSPSVGRGIAYSADNGDTWGPITFNKELISPVCQASTMTFGNVTYFSNPHSTSGRKMTTVMSAVDANATSWGNPQLIQAGSSAGYTCLVKGEVGVGSGNGGILYEGTNVGSIMFATFPLTKE